MALSLATTWSLLTAARPRVGRLATATLIAGALVVGGLAPSAAAEPSPAAAVCLTTPAVAPALVATTGSPSGVYAGVLLTGPQVDAAATIVNVGLDQGVSRRGILVALQTAMQASSLRPDVTNFGGAGLFQQYPELATGQYTTDDRVDPIAASRMFYGQLQAKIPGYDTDPRTDAELGDAAQGTHDASRIAAWEPLAQALTARFVPVVEASSLKSSYIAAGHGRYVVHALRGAGVAFAAADPVTPTTPDPSTTADPTTTTAPPTTPDPTTADPTASAPPTTDPSPTSADPTTATTADPTTPADPTATDTTTTAADPTAVPGTTDPTPTAPTTTVSTTADPITADPTTADPTTANPTTADPTSAPAATVDTDPAVVDSPAPAPATASDPGVGSDTVTSPFAGMAVECAPNANGGSTGFDAGNIISDEVFYNTASMTAEQIQAFLDRIGAACSGEYCIRSLRVTTADEPADQYCQAYTGGTDELASAVIARVSAACGINPQVMLVTLQKESALLTRTAVTASSYAAAWGWHCPDAGPSGSAQCDPQYAGFFNQAYGMAKQWSRYRVDPQKYNYHAGQTTTILWNVAQSGCGGAEVTIKNTATASLYNYTPYMPNAAALASYPGVGDSCSAYGNRNFFQLFQKYFGVTGGGAAIIINGVQVTIPNSPYVAPALRGQVITAPNEAVAKGLAAGFASLGLPYVWGGGTNGGMADQGCSRGGGSKNSCAGTVGFDCSGLTAYVLTQGGFAIGTNSGSQRAGGQAVRWADGLPGDVIGYSGHVAIYLGMINGVPYLLEAPDVGMFVQIRPVYFANNGTPVDGLLHRYWA